MASISYPILSLLQLDPMTKDNTHECHHIYSTYRTVIHLFLCLFLAPYCATSIYIDKINCDLAIGIKEEKDGSMQHIGRNEKQARPMERKWGEERDGLALQ